MGAGMMFLNQTGFETASIKGILFIVHISRSKKKNRFQNLHPHLQFTSSADPNILFPISVQFSKGSLSWVWKQWALLQFSNKSSQPAHLEAQIPRHQQNHSGWPLWGQRRHQQPQSHRLQHNREYRNPPQHRVLAPTAIPGSRTNGAGMEGTVEASIWNENGGDWVIRFAGSTTLALGVAGTSLRSANF